MSKSIVKFYNTVPQEDNVVIDSNALMEKKLREVSTRAKRKPAPPASGENLIATENAEAGFVEGIDADQIEALMLEEGDESNIIKSMSPEEEAEQIRLKAKAEADEIVATAEQLAQEYKNNSRREAEIECTRIKADAKQAGYQDGLVQAQDEYSGRMQEIDMKEQQLDMMYSRLIEEMEPRFVSTITGIYERIFHVELAQYQPILAQLISDAMMHVEGSKSYIVHVSKEDYPEIGTAQRALLEESAPGCSVDVVEDIGLSRNQCMLETDNGVFDVGLDRQLTELRNKLMILSYSAE
ncbi:MAG: hypothetical protein IJ058_05120 [Lachnospiraceae bacterium]|nr:hypothetical protein [Lachnospiraceae bacterium]